MNNLVSAKWLKDNINDKNIVIANIIKISQSKT